MSEDGVPEAGIDLFIESRVTTKGRNVANARQRYEAALRAERQRKALNLVGRA